MIVWVVFVGNRFVRLRNESHQALSGIDIQLQRRADLIPNLVAVVRGYAAHESETLDAVTQGRARLIAARTVGEKGDAAAGTTAALGRLFAVAEAYPDLKANEVFLKLQHYWAGAPPTTGRTAPHYWAGAPHYWSCARLRSGPERPRSGRSA